MYEVWDRDRIVYISNNYSKALDFWLEYKGKSQLGYCAMQNE